VYCVGMHSPLPFESIYQPTRLRVAGAEEASKSESFYHHDEAIRSMLEGRRLQERSMSIEGFLADPDNAIIYARPGWGKTTFLHHVFRLHTQSKTVLPILITLRRPSAVDDLERFAGSKIQNKTKGRILLLVDGYDELAVHDRRRVSEALLKYQALGVGNFFLSCREYYQVFQLAAREVRIDGFTLEDKYRFVRAFLSAYESKLDSKEVVDDFEAKDFPSSFLIRSFWHSRAFSRRVGRVFNRRVRRAFWNALSMCCVIDGTSRKVSTGTRSLRWTGKIASRC